MTDQEIWDYIVENKVTLEYMPTLNENLKSFELKFKLDDKINTDELYLFLNKIIVDDGAIYKSTNNSPICILLSFNLNKLQQLVNVF